jgi:Dolichyl-phosphate-mannose-protein mannosyltransferase
MFNAGKTSLRLASAWRQDRVFFTIIAMAVLFWLGALCVSILKQPFLLQKLVIPLVIWFYQLDHVPTAEGVGTLQSFMSMLTAAAGLMGGVAFSYGCLWRYFSRRLPTSAPSIDESASASPSTLQWCCLAVICVLAVILRLQHITRGLTLDELTTVIKFVDVPSLWTTLSTDDVFNNHLANSLLISLSQTILGRSEWVLRLPALLLGLTSLYCLWAFTRRLSGPTLAVLATAGLAFSPAHVFWSATARGYTGMLLFTLLSTSFYWQILRSPSRRKALLFILFSAVGILFHLFAAFVVLTQLVFLLYLAVRGIVSGRSGRILSVGSYRTLYLAFPVIVAISLACYAFILPQYFFNFHVHGHGPFKPLFPIEVLGLFSYGPVRSVSLGWWVLLGIMGSLCTIGWIAFRQKCACIANYWACLAILPLLIIMPARPLYLLTRFFLFWLPFFLILVGEGLLTAWHAATTQTARVNRTVFQGCCILLTGAILGTWIVRVRLDYPTFEHGFREAAWAMNREATPEIGLCAIGWASWRLQYYLQRDLFIPRDWDDFNQFAQRYSTITCADASFGDSPTEPTHVRDIRSFLAQNAASHRFHGIIVYSTKDHSG